MYNKSLFGERRQQLNEIGKRRRYEEEEEKKKKKKDSLQS
jgi:hypothetical protein